MKKIYLLIIFIVFFGGFFLGRLSYDYGYLVHKVDINKQLLNFMKPVDCKEFKGFRCNATDFMKPYRVFIITKEYELEYIKKAITKGEIEDISSFYPLELGDFIKYDFDDQAFIRISKNSPTHMQLMD